MGQSRAGDAEHHHGELMQDEILAGTISNCRSPHFLLVGLYIVVLGRGIRLLFGKKKMGLGQVRWFIM